jgi:hypothetical protein
MPPTDREFDLILAQIRELRETLTTSTKELRADIDRFEKCLAQRRGAEKAGIWLLGLIFSALGGVAQLVISRL